MTSASVFSDDFFAFSNDVFKRRMLLVGSSENRTSPWDEFVFRRDKLNQTHRWTFHSLNWISGVACSIKVCIEPRSVQCLGAMLMKKIRYEKHPQSMPRREGIVFWLISKGLQCQISGSGARRLKKKLYFTNKINVYPIKLTK